MKIKMADAGNLKENQQMLKKKPQHLGKEKQLPFQVQGTSSELGWRDTQQDCFQYFFVNLSNTLSPKQNVVKFRCHI